MTDPQLNMIFNFAQAIIIAFFGVVVVYLQQRNAAQAKERDEVAVAKVEEVKTTLADTTTSTDKKLGEIHKLVNSNMLAQLDINEKTSGAAWLLAKKVYAKEPTEENQSIVDEWEGAYRLAKQSASIHRGKQAEIDAVNGE